MVNEILFTETQKFRQWWLWLILLGINGLFLFGIVMLAVFGQQFGIPPMIISTLVIPLLMTLLLAILLFKLRLETQIKNDGIYVQFFPFHLSFRFYAWDKISKSFVRQYNPIRDYGGWGWRIGIFGKGRAFSVSGNKGLQLEFTDSKKLLIGQTSLMCLQKRFTN